MECLHRFCRDCIDKSMRLGYGPICSYVICLKCPVSVSFLETWRPDLASLSGLNIHFISRIIYTLLPVCRNNECPACRTHCASRRSLRDDPNYDALILGLYPDIDKYEEEVMYKLSRNQTLLSLVILLQCF